MPDHAEKFDDYTFYLDDEFPDDLDESRAATHIGMFLAWAQAKGLIEWAEELSESDRQWFDRLGRGEASFGEMAESLFDGKLIASMLTDDGYEFTAWYYQKYLEDYFDFLPAGAPSSFAMEDNQETFAKISDLLDRRWQEFQSLLPARIDHGDSETYEEDLAETPAKEEKPTEREGLLSKIRKWF
jgi:hypothetical protein